MIIADLEDNTERLNEMKSCDFSPHIFHFERRADKFIEFLNEYLNNIILVALDHDLEKYNPDESDPGDGRDVVRWMCQNSISLPVLIHTSNALMGNSMYFNLKDNGNHVDRIDPYDGIQWIRRSWTKRIYSILNNINSAQQSDASETMA